MIDVNHSIKARLDGIKTVDSPEFGNGFFGPHSCVSNKNKWDIDIIKEVIRNMLR